MSWWRRGYGIVRSLVMYHGQPWRTRSLPRIYEGFLGPGSLAFDVGSHVGNRIGAFRRLGARVVAVEPQPDFVAVLERLYGRDPEVTILHAGLAAEPGELVLHVCTAAPTLSTFSTEWIETVERDPVWADNTWDERITVPVRTLAQLVEEHGEPDFVKIDVEGFEPEVVRGASRPIKALSFEYVPASLEPTLAVIAHLEQWGGYEFRTSRGETHTFRESDWIDAATVRATLAELVARGEWKSGDVYARRR